MRARVTNGTRMGRIFGPSTPIFRGAGRVQNAKQSIMISQSEVWGGEYRYEGVITVASGATLDLSALPYSAIPKNIVRNAGGTIIRKFLPSDLPAVKLWCDFKDDKSLIFDANFSFSSATDKSGNGNHYANANGVSRSPLFRNGRLESDGVLNANGKTLATALTYSTTAGASYFFSAGYLAGGLKRRIFDGSVGNVLFGFHNVGVGGAYIDGNPEMFQRGFTPDDQIHIFSIYQTPSDSLIRQEWDDKPRQTTLGGAANLIIPINSGAFSAAESTNNFAIFDVVQGVGGLTDTDVSLIQGYLAWSSGLQNLLHAKHPYKTAAPIITLSDAGAQYSGTRWSRAYTPAASRTASSTFSGYSPSNSVLGNGVGWASATNTDPLDFLQLDLGSIKKVIGVSMQARKDYAQYVQTFTVRVSTDGITFSQHEGTHAGVTAWNVFEEFLAFFTTPVQARYVRILPVAFSGHKSVRCDALIEV